MKRALGLLLAAALSTPVLAQTPSTPIRAAANREAIRLAATAGTAAAQPSAVQQRSWPARHPVLTGALAGLSAGFAIGAATCRFPTAEGSSCDDYTFPGNARLLGGVTIGALGAAIGAGAGAVVRAWTKRSS